MYHDSIEIFELLDRWNHQRGGPPDIEWVKDLLNRRPSEAKRVSNIKNRTLLHKCMEYYGRYMDLARVFVQYYPESVLQQDNDGLLPLHLAVRMCNGIATTMTTDSGGTSSYNDDDRDTESAGVDVVRFLIEQQPESVITETYGGQLPLHLACQSNDEKVVRYLMECFPDALLQRDNMGHFPLDYALIQRKHVNTEMLQSLLDGSTGPLTLPDSHGRLCLHRIAAESHEKYDEAIQMLVQAAPGTLRVQDHNYQTPLFLACTEENNTLSQVYSLLRAWPEQVTTQFKAALITEFNGELIPATVPSASIDQIQTWIKRYPDALATRDVQGRLPLHYAAASATLDVVELLMTLYPEAAAVADKHKRTPFHYVAVRSNDDDGDGGTAASLILGALLAGCPDGLAIPDEDERLPWHYGDCARNDFVLGRTLEHHDDVETDLDMVPEHVRWDIVQVRRED